MKVQKTVRPLYIFGNWKQNPETLSKVAKFVTDFKSKPKILATVTVAIFPPIPYLPFFRSASGKIRNCAIGVQNISAHALGAHTGEVALSMLAHESIEYVLIGHSERRAAGETNQDTNAKLAEVFRAKLRPVLCVGERVRDDSPEYLAFIARQIVEAIANIPKAKLKDMIIAYEPVWAIGAEAKRSATPAECLEMVLFIRKVLSDTVGRKLGDSVPVLYGGSVDETNAGVFLAEGGANGFLVGRASLSVKSFGKIITEANDYIASQK